MLTSLQETQKVNIYMHPETINKLKQISKKTLIPVSALIRKGVDYVIKEYSK